MEAALVFKLWLATRRYTVQLAAAEAEAAAAERAAPNGDDGLTTRLTPIQR
jgi:hypothetical protein